jgi:hypothetical protein
VSAVTPDISARAGGAILWWLLQFPACARAARENLPCGPVIHCGSDEGRIKPEIPLATHDVHRLAVSNVLHWFMSPESSPVRNHRTRWAEEP